MTSTRHLSILFTGYAPVHFLCFRPLYERLRRHSGCRVFLSGGIRSAEDGQTYDADSLFSSFDVDPGCVLPATEIRSRHFDLLVACNTKMIEPGSAGTRIQLFHGISFRNRAIRTDPRDSDFYFLVGPYMRRRFAAAGLIGRDDPRAVDVGFPKTDHLLNGDGDREDVCSRYGFRGDRPIILYAPTGQKNNSLELFGRAVIGQLIATNRYDVIVKLHDHPKDLSRDWSVELASLEGPRFRLAVDLDVIPLMGAADLLLTDASSVSSEFSLLDRPMVFLDTPRLIRKARRRDGSMLDLESWGRRGGLVVDGPEQVAAAIQASLDDPQQHSTVRRAMAEDLFFNPGRATDCSR